MKLEHTYIRNVCTYETYILYTYTMTDSLPVSVGLAQAHPNYKMLKLVSCRACFGASLNSRIAHLQVVCKLYMSHGREYGMENCIHSLICIIFDFCLELSTISRCSVCIICCSLASLSSAASSFVVAWPLSLLSTQSMTQTCLSLFGSLRCPTSDSQPC